MTQPRKFDVPGYDSARHAAEVLGVAIQTIHRHVRDYGDLSRLEKQPVTLIPMPDGSTAASYTDAAVRLGVSEGCIRHHMHRHGHLRLVGSDRRVRSMEGERGRRSIALPELPGLEINLSDPRPETAPRAGLISVRPRAAARRVDVDAVIETIRQCRDEVLAEREVAG